MPSPSGGPSGSDDACDCLSQASGFTPDAHCFLCCCCPCADDQRVEITLADADADGASDGAYAGAVTGQPGSVTGSAQSAKHARALKGRSARRSVRPLCTLSPYLPYVVAALRPLFLCCMGGLVTLSVVSLAWSKASEALHYIGAACFFWGESCPMWHAKNVGIGHKHVSN